MPLKKGLGLKCVQSSKVNENPKDELTLSNEAMKRSDDNVSSKVLSHLKDSEMSSMVPPHQKEKEFGAARLSRKDKFELESKEKKLGTARMRRKERISFRQRNGAAYQVPNDWEELYDEMTTHKVTNSKTTKAKSDYHNSLKKKVFNDWNEVCKSKTTQEIDDLQLTQKEMRQFTPKTVRKVNSRWTGKDLASIEADKNKLLGWCEKGIIRDDTVHKTRNINSDDNETDNSSIQIKIKKKPITLGDFLPNAKVQSALKTDLNCEKDNLQLDKDLTLQPSVQLSECKENSDNETLIKGKTELKRPYFHVTRLPDDELEEVSCKPSTRPFFTKLPDGDEFNEVKTGPPKKTFNTQKPYSLKAHFCIYGIHYYAKRVCDSLFTKVDSLLDEMPQRSLDNFADAFRRLISGIENLRFSHLRDTKLKCQDKYCRWREIDISDDKPIERCCSHSNFGILSNLLAFEIKLTNVSENEYRLKKLLSGDYDKDNFRISYLMKRHKKALDLLEKRKSKRFDDLIDQFTNILFREIFILFESLPDEESRELRKSISKFNDSAWRMRELENRLQEDEDLLCCIPFRKRMGYETEAQSTQVSNAVQEKEVSSYSTDAYSTFEFKTKREYRRVFPLPKSELEEFILAEKRDLLLKNGSEIPKWMSEQCKPTTMTSPCAELEQCKPTEIVKPVLSEQCQPTMTTYDKYHSHEWECSDNESYVRPQVLDSESQAELDSQFAERIKQLTRTDENALDGCKIETNKLTKTDENVFENCKNEANILETEINVVSDDNISDTDSEQLSYDEFEYSSERDEEKYDYCTSPGCTRRTRKLSPTSLARSQEPITKCINNLVKVIVDNHKDTIAGSYSSDLKTEEGDNKF